MSSTDVSVPVLMPELDYPDPTAPIKAFTAEVIPPEPHRTDGVVDVEIAPTAAVVHPDLPAVPAWGYGLQHGPVTTPGPLLEVRANESVTVNWHNRLGSTGLPFLAWRAGQDATASGDPVQTEVGIGEPGSGGPRDLAGSPVGLTVTHLHGGHTIPDSDGWPDDMAMTNGTQLCRYDNDSDGADLGLHKVGPLQWYHDHAMGGTGLHVYAGLAGPYLVRDPREHQLRLPCSPDTGESVLMIADRNLVADPDLRLLHKTSPNTAECFGPLTTVNGVLWPALRVGPGVVRLRLLNASNARTFRLHLLDDGSYGPVSPDRVRVIGTDGGLLWRAQEPDVTTGIVLAPAERMDLLVNLSGLPDGHRIVVVNSAPAPFSAQDVLEPVTTSRPDLQLRFPQVMALLVDEEAPRSPHRDLWDDLTARTLHPRFRRVFHPGTPVAGDADTVSIEGHDHHPVLLVEDPVGHLTLVEVERDDTGTYRLQLPGDSAPQGYRAVNPAPPTPGPATGNFYAPLGIQAERGRWQVFQVLNTTGDVHPIHIHQSQFQPVGDQALAYRRDDKGAWTPNGPGRGYDAHERFGWKDTIRVHPSELVSIAIRFDLLGRYVYHCHILEHEDNEMMRPFLVVPRGMATAMSMSMSMPMSGPADTSGNEKAS